MDVLKTSFQGVEVGLDEDLRTRGNDAVAITAQSQNTGGSPCSQRLYAGSNWPVLAIAPVPPVAVGPESASCACLGN